MCVPGYCILQYENTLLKSIEKTHILIWAKDKLTNAAGNEFHFEQFVHE